MNAELLSLFVVLKVIIILQAPLGDQKINYTKNNHNEFNFMEAKGVFLGAQQCKSKNTKYANPPFF